MARTKSAIIVSIATGLLLAAGSGVLSAEPVPYATHCCSWGNGERNGSDTTPRIGVSVTDGQCRSVIHEKSAPDDRQRSAKKLCVGGFSKVPSGAGVVLDSSLLDLIFLEMKDNPKLPAVVHPNSVLKQKPSKPKPTVTEIHPKKRRVPSDQPWDSEFLVQNPGQPVSSV